MCRSMVDIHSATAEIKQGKKEEEERINHRTKIYCPHVLHTAAINNAILLLSKYFCIMSHLNNKYCFSALNSRLFGCSF